MRSLLCYPFNSSNVPHPQLSQEERWKEVIAKIAAAWNLAAGCGKCGPTRHRCAVAAIALMRSIKTGNWAADGSAIIHPQAAWDFDKNEPVNADSDRSLLEETETVKEPAVKKQRIKESGVPPIARTASQEEMSQLIQIASSFARPVHSSDRCSVPECPCGYTRSELKDENVSIEGVCPFCKHPRAYHPK